MVHFHSKRVKGYTTLSAFFIVSKSQRHSRTRLLNLASGSRLHRPPDDCSRRPGGQTSYPLHPPASGDGDRSISGTSIFLSNPNSSIDLSFFLKHRFQGHTHTKKKSCSKMF
ncbi:hypothetical protein L2E82_06839 [Cichorium intybus]|uniref:Uncharacterized protein n=1 Tax=Cichorium intybus TaxID=13427 RepID=A0ACB9HB23_CICIN|nr:hypothetical protein L2E82_06839 [Cichorium intybus]